MDSCRYQLELNAINRKAIVSSAPARGYMEPGLSSFGPTLTFFSSEDLGTVIVVYGFVHLSDCFLGWNRFSYCGSRQFSSCSNVMVILLQLATCGQSLNAESNQTTLVQRKAQPPATHSGFRTFPVHFSGVRNKALQTNQSNTGYILNHHSTDLTVSLFFFADYESEINSCGTRINVEIVVGENERARQEVGRFRNFPLLKYVEFYCKLREDLAFGDVVEVIRCSYIRGIVEPCEEWLSPYPASLNFVAQCHDLC